MWVTQLSIVDWVHSKTQVLLATLRTQNQTSGRDLLYFGSRTFVAISWMCEKQTSVSPQFYRIWNHFVGCWTANGWITCSRFMGCCDGSAAFAFNKQHFTCSRKLFARHNQTETKRKPRCWSIVWCGQRSHKYKFFTRWVSAAYLWGQRSRDQNDH